MADMAMREMMSPVRDEHYDLLHTVQLSLEHIYRMDTYIADAERRGDRELADWFRRIQQNNRKASEQGTQMLLERMGR